MAMLFKIWNLPRTKKTFIVGTKNITIGDLIAKGNL